MLSLGAGKEVAEIQRLQELLLADPAPLFDNLAVHERDLSGRTAEAEAAYARRNADEFVERRRCWRSGDRNTGGIVHAIDP